MKYYLESKYLVIFVFSLALCVATLLLSINNFQPFLIQHILTSCTAAYATISANSLVITSIFVLGLLSLLVCLFLKLILSSYKTSQSLERIKNNAEKKFPQSLDKISSKLSLSKNIFIITNHQKPLAMTAGLFFPKIIFSKGLLKRLSYEELEAVVLHESYHQKQKHGLLYVVAEAISVSLSWILPVLRDVTDNMKIEFENMADNHALQYQGDSTHIASALSKLSGNTVETQFPSFATIIDRRLEHLHSNTYKKLSVSKSKVLLSITMLLILCFFASVPVTKIQTIVQAEDYSDCSEENVCTDLCVNRFEVGMSKWTNSSRILPASVF